MNSRQRSIQRSRSICTDAQLIAFFRAIRDQEEPLAAKFINEQLDEGESLESILLEGDETGYTLAIRRRTNGSLKISFGCFAGPEAGDGGEWIVKFEGSSLVLITQVLLFQA